MSNKQFSERLNKELDNIGVPVRNDERIDALSKLIRIPKFKAEAFLHGISIPDPEVLAHLAEVLEVSPDWLLGKSEKK